MPYELFQDKATRFASPQLTIRSGRISFNADAGDMWDKLGTPFAHLFWNAAECKIAIRPAKNEDENTFRVSALQGKRGKTMSALSFLNYIQWAGGKAAVVDAVWNGAERIIEAALPKENITAPAAETKKKKLRFI